MALAIVLIAIVVAAVLFHLISPWWLTPLASNWGRMDDTMLITLVITGVVFVVINLFVAYTLIRYRRREGRRAAYQPDNKMLEHWLIGLTAIGIVAMLAPGLFVYAELITPPQSAMSFEVLGQQWQWHFRFPGKDGKLGTADVRYMNADNPFGLNPNDPNGQDDVLVEGQEVHIPLGQPVQVLLRSKDVLHDFFVPPFRARVNMVPGMVTRFWFTPTKVGRFEVLCAQLCGVGHSNMRGYVVVDPDEATFNKWLGAQPTFAQTQHKGPESAGTAGAQQGKLLAQAHGCFGCHSVDGSAGVGPTWKNLYGQQVPLTTGNSVLADEAYLKESIQQPQAKIVQGFGPVMPAAGLNDQDVAALVAYIKSLSSKGAGG